MHTNRLAHEKSPYLLQHAHNPVDWYAWGEEAFAKARDENKPIFLSVGYSTCHWCHVMERESFESPAIAEVLNRDFVPIKVDREERPDVDRIYMLFVQATTGGGGWPMSVWLTPTLEPFFGGTYFPPDNRYGRPGFQAILEHLANLWKAEGDRIRQSGGTITAQLRQHAEVSSGRGGIDVGVSATCFYALRRSYDPRYGGFGGAPKFPRPAVFHFLLRYWDRKRDPEALDMTQATLMAMARGGMYDQLGGGFHRYSVDERWFVPHFEKMLYDQAQLAVSYLEACQISGEARLAEAARGILDYVLRDLTHLDGGFFSAEDADSVIDPANPHEKGEGAFYVWSRAEIGVVLGEPDASVFAEQYGVRDGGNVDADPHGEFTGKNILYQAKHAALEPEWRRLLLEARSRRVRPHLDDKILSGWNGLMISAFAKAAQILDDDRYGQAARRAAQFLTGRLFDSSTGWLLRRFRDGEAAIDAFLDDYACLAQAFLELYETYFDLADLRMAERLAGSMIERFADREHGGFFNTPEGDPSLLLRMKEDYDGAEPTGNSVAALTLLRLADMLGREDFRQQGMRVFDAFSTRLNTAPVALPQMLSAWLYATGPRQQVVLAGPRDGASMREMLRVVRKQFAPNRGVLLVDTAGPPEHAAAWLPELVAMQSSGAEATAYVCENHTCRLPVHDAVALERELNPH